MQTRTGLPIPRATVSALVFLTATAFWSTGFPAGADAAAIFTVKPEFLVNTTRTAGRQSHPAIAMNEDGLMLVTWSTQTILAEDIQARAYYPDGEPWTGEFPVNALVRSGTQHSPDCDTNGSSRWVAVWASFEGLDQHRVYAKLYSSTKVHQQIELSVDGDVFGPSTTRTRPDVALFPNGDFIVIWGRTEPGGSELDTYVRLFDGMGNPLSSPVKINQAASIIPPEDSTGTPDIAVREIDGHMVAFAAWACWKNPADPIAELRARRFDPYGLTFEEEFQVSPPVGPAHQGRPTLDINGMGDILVTWQERNPADMLYDIHARKYTAADSAWGGLIDPPGNDEFEQHRAHGLLSEGGGIVLAWTRTHPQISDDIFLQMYDRTEAPLLAEPFQVNENFSKVQRRPGLAMLESGGNSRIGVVWESSTGDGDSYGIFGALLDFDGFPVVGAKRSGSWSTSSTLPYPGWDAAAGSLGDEEPDPGIPAPGAFRHAAYPNPFNPATTIRFELERPATVTLAIHDLAGRRIATLAAAADLGGGAHEYRWSGMDDAGRSVASGPYVYRLQAGGNSATGRLTVIK
ncbi:MAG: FlgD immunoglobulin-like domain containing protein [Candidatus Krumholzibacteriia bacterium]